MVTIDNKSKLLSGHRNRSFLASTCGCTIRKCPGLAFVVYSIIICCSFRAGCFNDTFPEEHGADAELKPTSHCKEHFFTLLHFPIPHSTSQFRPTLVAIAMASSKAIQTILRPPKRSAPLYQPCTACLRSRPFSTTGHQANVYNSQDRTQSQMLSDPKGSGQKAQPGSRSRMRTMTMEELPDDVGLVPETFIKPRRASRPSWFTKPKQRANLEWYWIKNRFQGIMS